MAAKGAWIIILCSCFAHFILANTSFQLIQIQTRDFNSYATAGIGFLYLFYPLVGLVTDVYFTRYKAVLASTVIQIVTNGLGVIVCLVWALLWYCNSNLVIQGGTIEHKTTDQILVVLGGLSAIPMIVGLGIFEANAIQFGMDQLLEESSEKISTFIHWYYWSIGVGISLMTLPITAFLSIGIYTKCSVIDIHVFTNKSYDRSYYVRAPMMMSAALLQTIMASVSFIVLLRCKKHLSIEPAGNNPFATVYQVLKYSWKHKVPERRSAFTYWEEDIPRRIDLGKNKYGGPFTTEEVEDTKSFFRILLLLLSLFGFHLSGNGFTFVRQLTIKLCPSAWVMLLDTASPPLLETITALLFIGLFDYLLLPYFRRYVPSLFKRLGIGLSLILLQELAGIMIVWIANKDFVEPHCNSTKTTSRNHFAHCFLGRFNFNKDGDCAAANITKHYPPYCEGEDVNNLFLWILIPQLVRSVAYLLVFTTALEFICAQAPLRMKGLLIGIWYATFALQYLATHVPDEKIQSYETWIIFHGVRAGLILFSLILYCIVAKRYRYRLRDEVVMNEQFLVEEIYERQLLQAEEYERDKETREPVSCTLHSSINYGAIPKINDS